MRENESAPLRQCPWTAEEQMVTLGNMSLPDPNYSWLALMERGSAGFPQIGPFWLDLAGLLLRECIGIGGGHS